MKLKQVFAALAIFTLALLIPSSGRAAVSAEEAAKLRSALTPLGAERAGNKADTIPAWDGGLTTVWPGYQSGQPRPDPFAEEKPLFGITAGNMDKYADNLSDGAKALLSRFPTFRLDVFPTHRTAAAPQWVYDNTLKNATLATTRNDGLTVEGAYGGIPFPIPQSGREAMWNHLLAWKGESVAEDAAIYLVSGRKPVLTARRRADFQYPYYYRDGAVETFPGNYALARYLGLKPPSNAGEMYLAYEPIDQAREPTKVWAYSVGQRRVRRAPTIAYDTPDSTTSGVSFIDEVWLFKGGLDRYDWRLLGKQEMVVPYNNNGFFRKDIEEVLAPHHLNPDHVRWELHRVWVVEARLAAGKYHPVVKRRLYLDEDTWLALLYDGWDDKDRLWHVAYALPLLVPELPAVVTFPSVAYDLVNDRYAALYLLNDSRMHYQVVPNRPEDYFSPAALGGEGVR